MKDLNPAVKESLTAQDHIRDATKMVKCICGDIYPADSFGAGFIAATGRCQNCCAAEQEEQEPVAWLYDWEHEGEIVTGWVTQDFETTKFNNGHNARPLYAAPQPVQEPIGYVIEDDSGYTGSMIYANKGGDCFLPVYLTPPVRTKDLTDSELDALWHGNTEGGWRGLFRAVIAADREKNRG